MAVSGWGIFLIILVLVAVLGSTGYILYAHLRARRLGLPPPNLNPFSKNKPRNAAPNYAAPAPAPGGIKGWVQDKIQSLRNTRTAGGAYESSGYRGGHGGTRGGTFGPLDPDEAWDARVDHESGPYYEEQELGLQDPGAGPYGGGGYGGELGERGRSRSRQRELDQRYDEEVHGKPRENPFADGNADPSNMSLRSVSPRPHVDARPQGLGHKRNQSSYNVHDETSPTERRSIFQENV